MNGMRLFPFLSHTDHAFIPPWRVPTPGRDGGQTLRKSFISVRSRRPWKMSLSASWRNANDIRLEALGRCSAQRMVSHPARPIYARVGACTTSRDGGHLRRGHRLQYSECEPGGER